MKLFVFRPSLYGCDTYFVMAENGDEARAAVKAYSKAFPGFVGHDDWGGIDYRYDDGDPVYVMETYNEGEVTENSNA